MVKIVNYQVQKYLQENNLLCDFPENVAIALRWMEKEMPQFVKMRLSAEKSIINCFFISLQPPFRFPKGNEAYPIPINCSERDFENICEQYYKFYQNKSKILCEKLAKIKRD